MRRFLISTLLSLTLFSMITPSVLLAQTNTDIRIDGNMYHVDSTKGTRLSKLKDGSNYYDDNEYQEVLNVDLTKKSDSSTLTNVWINRDGGNLGTYSWYNNTNQNQSHLSNPPQTVGTTNLGFQLFNVNFPDLTPQDRQVVRERSNPALFNGYTQSKHGIIGGVPLDPATGLPVEDPEPNDGISAGTTTSEFTKLLNPLGGAGINTTGDAIDKITTVLMIIAVPFVTIMIMYAGFSYLTAMGNPEKITAANKRAMWTLLGTLLLFGAATIGNLIIKTVQKVTTDGIPQAPATTTPPVTTPPTPGAKPSLPGTSTSPVAPPVAIAPPTQTTNASLVATYNSGQAKYLADAFDSTIKFVRPELTFDVTQTPTISDTVRYTVYLLTDPNDSDYSDNINAVLLPTTSRTITPSDISNGQTVFSLASDITVEKLADLSALGIDTAAKTFTIGIAIEIGSIQSVFSYESLQIKGSNSW